MYTISKKDRQTQCWKLPRKVGSGEGLYEASLTPAIICREAASKYVHQAL